MILSAEMLIHRDGSFFNVTVIRGFIGHGYYEHPETGEETKYALTESEQSEAWSRMNPDDDVADTEAFIGSRTESDNAADAYFGNRGMMADRRGA